MQAVSLFLLIFSHNAESLILNPGSWIRNPDVRRNPPSIRVRWQQWPIAVLQRPATARYSHCPGLLAQVAG